jgi:membrane peptidoglycan carboxypeptidase
MLQRRGLKRKSTVPASHNSTIRVHHNITSKSQSRKDIKQIAKAEKQRLMPKSRIKRFFWRLHPKRVLRYWFSKDGLIMSLKITGIGIVCMFMLLVGVFAYFRKDLPNIKDISGSNLGGSVRYYDRTGQVLLWEDYDAVKRVPVKSDQISQYIKDATIAIEDRQFYDHSGFNTKGILRAGISNVTGGDTAQGGSTITQQLVKLSQDWGQDKSYSRKIKEIILAVELERSNTKDEILTGYLNAAPYGNIQYGVEVASQDYFGKSAKDLTLEEAAFLASIPKSPSYYSPYGAYFADGGKEEVIGRMQYTLQVMKDMGKITDEQYKSAKDVDVLARVKTLVSRYENIKAPYFVLSAKEEFEARGDGNTAKRGGMKVITTLDLNLQTIAEEEVTKGLTQVKRQGGDVAAMTVADVETGQIVAMVGGPDFTNPEYGQNNYSRTPLPPGSSFKPYDYSTLIDNSANAGAGSVLYDTKGPLPGYLCTTGAVKNGNCLVDYDFKYPGPLTLRYALGGSRNVPAVKAMLTYGVDKTIDTANQMMNGSNANGYGYKCYRPGTVGFTAENEAACGGAAAIGDGAYLKQDEHVSGLATLARGGTSIPRTYILQIIDESDKVQEEWQPAKNPKQVIKPDTAYIISDMLSDPKASYLGKKIHRYSGAKGQWKFAVKTGTTNDLKDGWMTGYSTKYATAVWVGYHNRTKEMSGFMENMTLPIWNGFMTRAHKDLEPKDFTKPAGIQTLPAYVVTTHVGASSVEPSSATDIFPSWYKAPGTNNQKQVIDIVSNKIATECTPERAKKDLTKGSAGTFSVDIFVNGSAVSEGKDDVHLCTDSKPAVTLSVSGSGGSYLLTATATQGTHALSSDAFAGTLNFKVNGQIISGGSFNVTSSGQTVSVTYYPDASGVVDFSAEIIDSVLYESVSTITGIAVDGFTVNAAAAGSKLISVSFSAVSGASSYTACFNGSLCQSVSPGTSNIVLPSGGGYVVTVTASASDGSTITTGTSTAVVVPS